MYARVQVQSLLWDLRQILSVSCENQNQEHTYKIMEQDTHSQSKVEKFGPTKEEPDQSKIKTPWHNSSCLHESQVFMSPCLAFCANDVIVGSQDLGKSVSIALLATSHMTSLSLSLCAACSLLKSKSAFHCYEKIFEIHNIERGKIYLCS